MEGLVDFTCREKTQERKRGKEMRENRETSAAYRRVCA